MGGGPAVRAARAPNASLLPGDTAACAPGLCSHLCLLSPVHPQGYQCACPEGLFLLPSGKCAELSIAYAEGKAISLVQVGPGARSQLVQKWLEALSLQDVDWQRSVLYGTDDSGTLLRVVGHPGRREAISTGLPVCSARVDIRSGDLYWLACNRKDIGVSRAPGMAPRILHPASSSIQHLFLDWQRGALYWLAQGKPLQRLSLAGGVPQDAWNETWPEELPAAMDSKAFSLLWSSASGLRALSLAKRQAVTLAPSWPHGLVAAFEPYLVSTNGTALLLWDRRTLTLVLSMPAVDVQGVVTFVHAELQAAPVPLPAPTSKGSTLTLPPPAATSARTTTTISTARPTTSTTRLAPSKTTTVPIPVHVPPRKTTITPTTTARPTLTKTTSVPATTTTTTTTPRPTPIKIVPAPTTTTAWLTARPTATKTTPTRPTKTTPTQPATTTTTSRSSPNKTSAMQPTATTQRISSPARVVPPTLKPPPSPVHPSTPVPHLSCPRTHVLCRDGTECVAQEYVCDGEKDCVDGSDEDGCAELCDIPGAFRCSSGAVCVRPGERCDGVLQCPDASDEVGCWSPTRDCALRCDGATRCIPESWLCHGHADCHPAPCQSHEYPCGLGTCLNASLVCDGQRDCADGSDEGGNCSTPCQLPCSHLCYPSPQGPRCQCTPGYRLAEDGLSCMDVDECKEQGEGACSQICLNALGTYSCGCLPGYLLEPDGHICKLTGPEPTLLVAVQSEVLSYGLRSGREEVLLATDKERVIFSLDYDPAERKVFWVDLAMESIRWQGLDSGKKGTLVKGVRSDCIAVDWVGRNLYWTDGAAGRVLATRLGAAWRGVPEYTVVLDGDLDRPHSLVLQPLAG
nr:PREDICTED: uncharacterized protein LOC104149877 [Struthio camelus australis]